LEKEEKKKEEEEKRGSVSLFAPLSRGQTDSDWVASFPVSLSPLSLSFSFLSPSFSPSVFFGASFHGWNHLRPYHVSLLSLFPSLFLITSLKPSKSR
jgi:hypothetical protein